MNVTLKFVQNPQVENSFFPNLAPYRNRNLLCRIAVGLLLALLVASRIIGQQHHPDYRDQQKDGYHNETPLHPFSGI
jgi:hypothetical protein